MSYVIPWSSIPKDLQEPLHRYVSEAEGKLCGYCKEELCNSESGRMVVELYLGKQNGHAPESCTENGVKIEIQRNRRRHFC